MKHLLVSINSVSGNFKIGENLGIRYLKSFLNKYNYEVDILENDYNNHSDDELIKIINNYDTIGFSINYEEQLEHLKKLLDILDATNKIIYTGGHYATIISEKMLRTIPKINFCILSDGELPLLNLFNTNFDFTQAPNVIYLKDNLIYQNKTEIIEKLDCLPYPFRDNNSSYLGDNHFMMITSRGCYNNCSYCSVSSYSKKFYNSKIRYRSAENIYNEILFLIKEYNIKYISFIDDLFLGTDMYSKKRAFELCELLINNNIEVYFSIECTVTAIQKDVINKLYASGLRHVFLGIENFTSNALECFNKAFNINHIEQALELIENTKIDISYGFIMYYPEMKYEEIIYNLEKLYEHKILNFASITNKLIIYEGTSYYAKDLNEITFINGTNEYYFLDEKINIYIESCINLRKNYNIIERNLNRLKFLSLTNNSIDISVVNSFYINYIYELYKILTEYYNNIKNNLFNESILVGSLNNINNDIQSYMDQLKI